MSKISFGKYQGAGNDFILIDDRALSFPASDSSLIQSLCQRKFGVGADGVILLQNDPNSDFRMRIYNSDGSEAESCGNGLRCLMRFIADLGLPQKEYKIAAGPRIVSASFLDSRIAIEMGAPRDLSLYRKIAGKEIHTVDTGVPHALLFVPDVNQIDLPKEGSFLRRHSAFHPRGTNVNFAAVQPDGAIHARTFERGVEGETLACGTGAAAIAAIASQTHRLPSPISVVFPGGALEIHFDPSLTQLRMVGPAVRVFSGELER